ncbi:unnamed protein product [Clonostachys rosea f. rosea IK726]|jgi:hypothetical protein|uniref:Uncharacterized protein n=2 Tax=Bionectria ochroleuca TaxID=29856 RepID=A0A8H7KE21_BIOOC|nr:unnamed protein product [Clonostachys rosea f. rosea IK726]
MVSSVGEWKESVEKAIDDAQTTDGGGIVEACEQIATLSHQVNDVASTPLTDDERKQWKKDFERKFKILDDLSKKHVDHLTDQNRKARKIELAGAKKTFKTVIKFLD